MMIGGRETVSRSAPQPWCGVVFCRRSEIAVYESRASVTFPIESRMLVCRERMCSVKLQDYTIF